MPAGNLLLHKPAFGLAELLRGANQARGAREWHPAELDLA